MHLSMTIILIFLSIILSRRIVQRAFTEVLAFTIKNPIKFRLLAHLQVNNMEVLWVWLRPKRLPRGVPRVIIGTIYHPPNADDSEMLDYLSTTLTIIEGQYPGCGIFLAGDFNRLNVSRLSTQVKMKQLVRYPTRGD